MKVLITGNLGYVGSVLTRYLHLLYPNIEITGYDTAFFAHCLTNSKTLPELCLKKQYFGEIREFPEELLKGIDAVIHLAAISNDPMGSKYEKVTDEINYQASKRIAELARDNRVNHFVFASSCSMYGAATEGARKETDTLNPLTAYSRSKVAMEEALANMDPMDMVITALRFSTACGMSERLRLDLVLNDFVACALTSGEITILSDGTPWRPLIDVKDMCRAIDWAINRQLINGGQFVQVNVGSDDWNYQVSTLALAVQKSIEGTKVSINKDAPPDKRSYKVDFSLYRKLAPLHQPIVTLEQSIDELKTGLFEMKFSDNLFRNSDYMRLKMLERHKDSGRLNDNLRWVQ